MTNTRSTQSYADQVRRLAAERKLTAVTKSSLTAKTDQTVDEFLATMTAEQIANMTEAQMEAITEGVGFALVPERICSCDRPMPAEDGECQRCFALVPERI